MDLTFLWSSLVTILAFLATLALLSHICLQRRLLPGVFAVGQYPIVGHWPGLFKNVHRFNDWKYDFAVEAEAHGHELLQRAGPFLGVIELISPRLVQHVLKDNFDNYIKGPRWIGIFQELLGGGIFNADGENWRTTRKTASHMFSASKLNNFMLESFLKHAEVLAETMEAQIKKQEEQANSSTTPPPYLDMQKQFSRYTMDAICEIGFGVNLDSLRSKEQPFFVTAFDSAQEAVTFRFLGPTFKYKLYRLLNIRTEKTLAEVMPILNEFVYGIIQTRESNPSMYNQAADLLSLFLAEGAKHNQELDRTEIRDLIMNFMLAGRDTTASALTWFFYEVSQRPDVRKEILQEIDELFGPLSADDSVTKNITDDRLKRATYLEAVLLETLRLHPPVPNDNKFSVKADTLPDGTKIPAGLIVTWSPYSMGRLKSIWGDDVLEFKPSRWFTSSDSGVRTLIQKSPFAFPQFNAGFRMCLGRSMALLESKVVAISLLRKYRLETKADHDSIYRFGMILFMKYGLPMLVHRRDE